MKLTDLLQYDDVIIQCHDNPDADAIASTYGLYRYFSEKGKHVVMAYSGYDKMSKANLCLLTEYLEIQDKFIYFTNPDDILAQFGPGEFSGILITSDCQYGAGNVRKIPATNVAIIDHHMEEIKDVPLSNIRPEIGSCSTLVWLMLKEVGYDNWDDMIATALYFGLYCDTNGMSEIANPYDRDLRDNLDYSKTTLLLLRNSNFSLGEFKLAGNAMDRCVYDSKYQVGIIEVDRCDPNMLGLINDFMLQCAEVMVGIVYNVWPNGYKLSVRTCGSDARAEEIAEYVTSGVGSGGGHRDKAGGFISIHDYNRKYNGKDIKDYLEEKMKKYFDECEVIHACDYEADLSSMKEYVKKKTPFGYVIAKDVFPIGTPIVVRTLEADLEIDVTDDLIIMIGIKGEVYPNKYEKFLRAYTPSEEVFSEDSNYSNLAYVPTIYNRNTGEMKDIGGYAKICIGSGGVHIYAKELKQRVKIYTAWDPDNYMLGKPGDYIAARTDDLHDVYVIEKNIFYSTYEEL